MRVLISSLACYVCIVVAVAAFYNLPMAIALGLVFTGSTTLLLAYATQAARTNLVLLYHCAIVAATQPVILLLSILLPNNITSSAWPNALWPIVTILGALPLFLFRPHKEDFFQFGATSVSIIMGQAFFAANLIGSLASSSEVSAVGLWWVNQGASLIAFFVNALTPRLLKHDMAFGDKITGLKLAKMYYFSGTGIFLFLALLMCIWPNLGLLCFAVYVVVTSVAKIITIPLFSHRKAHFVSAGVGVAFCVYLASFLVSGVKLPFPQALMVVLIANAFSNLTVAILLRRDLRNDDYQLSVG